MDTVPDPAGSRRIPRCKKLVEFSASVGLVRAGQAGAAGEEQDRTRRADKQAAWEVGRMDGERRVQTSHTSHTTLA